jgi:hypothetical protein
MLAMRYPFVLGCLLACGCEDPDSSCSVVVASDYDRSCATDDDCVTVGEVPQCPPAACNSCGSAAINKLDSARYQSAFSRAIANLPTSERCNCPCEVDFAICRAGQCQAAYCAPPVADTLLTCADAGGVCSYAANTACSGLGPPGACAYSDEICCLR